MSLPHFIRSVGFCSVPFCFVAVFGCSEPSNVAPRAAVGQQAAVVQQAVVPEPAASCKEGSEPEESDVRVAVADTGIVFGDPQGARTIVVFTDLECPFCMKLHTTVESFLAKHPKGYRIVVRQHPLPFHDHGAALARASLAAERSGKGSAFIHAAFAAARKDPARAVEMAAKEVGLDVATLARESESAAVSAALAADQADAERLSIRGTPTFFVDGKRVVGARADFETIVTN